MNYKRRILTVLIALALTASFPMALLADDGQAGYDSQTGSDLTDPDTDPEEPGTEVPDPDADQGDQGDQESDITDTDAEQGDTLDGNGGELAAAATGAASPGGCARHR